MKKLLLTAAFFVINTSTIAEEVSSWEDRVALSGLIEVEAAYADSTEWGDGESTSDLVLATAEIGLSAKLTGKISANFVTLYKEGDIDFGMHTGFLQFDEVADNESLSISIGKMYLPFGQLETNLVNDSLALELVSPEESLGFRESGVVANWSIGKVEFSAYVFNGNADEDDQLDDFGLSLSVGSDSMNFGIDYLSNVSDSAMILEALGMVPGGELSAFSLNGAVAFGSTTVIFEHLQTDDLDEIGFSTSDAPSVSQLDVGLDLGNGWSAGIAYQRTNDAAALGLPESRIAVGVATSIAEVIDISIEFWRDNDYSDSDQGTDEDFNAAVIQFAAEF